MLVFNPEHDLCMANGDANFVPPSSALKFARDCASLVGWIETDSDDNVTPWGWDAALKRHLQKSGVTEELLPSDDDIEYIRSMSHRRMASEASDFICANIRSDLLRPVSDVVELYSEKDVAEAVALYGDAVAKSPWSGSGKGLRWLRAGELSSADMGWCRNVIARQGSVMLERRHRILQDFAMLYSTGTDGVSFEGYSLFFNDNGIYKGNVLASDDWIFKYLASKFLPADLISGVRENIRLYLSENFTGKYSGYIGVDMFVYESGDGKFRLAPCVEINVRMTMGLLARRLFDNHIRLQRDSGGGVLVFPDGHATQMPGAAGILDGRYVMTTEYSPRSGELCGRFVENADSQVISLTDISPDTEYAVVISPINRTY